MRDIISRSFHLNFTVMKVVGLYPLEGCGDFYRFYSILVYVVSMLPSCVFGLLRFAFDEDVTIASYSDLVLFGIIVHTFKLSPLIRNRSRMQDCIQRFDSIHYGVTKPEHRRIIEECVATCRRNSRAYFGGCVVTLCCFTLATLLLGDFEALPLNVWLPDTLRTVPSVFFCIYFDSLLGVVYVTLATSVVDPLISGLCRLASAQLRILKHHLQFLDRYKPDNTSRPPSDSCVVYRKIVKYVRLYQEIVSFVTEYEKCFSIVVFGQFTASLLMIGVCCFQLSATLDGVSVVLNILSLSLLFFELFFYCNYGTLLLEENDTLVNAIYMSRWYEYDQQSKKALLILMERSKQPLIITAGKVLDLSLETFTLILRRSYSLVTVLKSF